MGCEDLESVLSYACKIKIQNFEGPFDLLFHLIEKDQVNIYDIPINEITDQYMDYLFAMQELDLEITSEFLVMAATLLHIKSRMLLPDRREKQEDEADPREELVLKLVEYKKYKEFSQMLKQREVEWSKLCYKLPETMEIKRGDEILELSPEELKRVYLDLLDRNERKMNHNVSKMTQILQHEKVSLKSKIREVVRNLINRSFFIFSEIFSLKSKSKIEVVTGFLAILELSKMKKIRIEQKKQWGELMIYRADEDLADFDEERIAVDGF